MAAGVSELLHGLLAALSTMRNDGLVTGWTVLHSDRSEAVYVVITCPGGMLPLPQYTVRIAMHPVTAPGPQFLLGPHQDADGSTVESAVTAVREWAEIMYRSRGSGKA